MSSQSDRKNSPEKLHERKINRLSTLAVLATIMVLAGATWMVVKMSAAPIQNLEQKLVETKALVLDMRMRVKGSDSDNVIAEGDVLEMVIDTTRPVYATVMVHVAGGTPLAVFRGVRIPPGQSRVLEKADNKFQYEVSGNDAGLRVCLVYALSSDELLQVMRQYAATPDLVGAKVCRQWKDWQLH